MTVSSTNKRNDYTGDNSTDTYNYTFKIFSEDHLLVTTELSGVETTLTLTTDYTVSGVGETAGGSITLVAGNLATGTDLTIRRVLPLTQLTDLKNQGSFKAVSHEDQFDKLVMICQQQQDELDRSLKLSETDSSTSASLPVPSANKLLAWNDAGTALENITNSDGTFTNSNTVDNALIRGDGTGGNIQASLLVVDDSGNMTGVVDLTQTGTHTLDGEIIQKEISTPSTPASGYGAVYFKSDGLLYQIDDAGTETRITSGAASSLALGASSELTISSGAITVTGSHHSIDTESDAATDDLNTISGMSAGDIAFLRPENSSRAVTLRHNTGNLAIAGDFDIILEGSRDYAIAIHNGTDVSIFHSNIVRLTKATAQTTTSGTSFDFTDIPPWVERVTVLFNGVSLSGTDALLVQIGDSGGIETTGYTSQSIKVNSSGGSSGTLSTSGFVVNNEEAGSEFQGHVVIENVTGNEWVATVGGYRTAGAGNPQSVIGGGSKSLGSALDRVRVLTDGANTFDAGKVNIIYE